MGPLHYARGDSKNHSMRLLRERLDQALAFSIGSGYTSVKHSHMVAGIYESDLITSGRERGVHELAMKSGVGFPCPISWVTLPMKKSCDDEEIELVQWPILCPSDFVCSQTSRIILSKKVTLCQA